MLIFVLPMTIGPGSVENSKQIEQVVTKMLSKEQENFWDILKHPYPLKKEQRCNNCKHGSRNNKTGELCSFISCTTLSHTTDDQNLWVWKYAQ